MKNLFEAGQAAGPVLVQGWVRTRRDAKALSFVEINDGSSLANLQSVIEEDSPAYAVIKDLTTGAAVSLIGLFGPSLGSGQRFELKCLSAEIIGPAGLDYPLQKKRHTDEYLREIAHLRPRTNKFGALTRLRSQCAWAAHDFFRQRGFYHVHTPIVTGSDCEGAGEAFRVTTLPDGQNAGPEDDFFGRKAWLTVSGQLEAEMLALALDRVYVFGPAFRAENSNTSRHAAEFWMIEPEASFFDLNDDMLLAEDFIKYLVNQALNEGQADLELFDRFVEKGLIARLENLIKSNYVRVTYAEAIKRLAALPQSFERPPTYGADLASDHEKALCEIFGGPVFVYDYPSAIKPFYMRLSDDSKTVAAMDLLVPRVGELIGGSQREERLNVLLDRMSSCGLKTEDYWWYIDSRRWGSVPHSGFGLGFERFLMMLTGVNNIRDVCAFPRTPNNLEF
ncbi:MAG: asparagine--tRNA ligase [Deltaproteobacteria bacterium]|nr:asparagine--tRNA ligase [Deltaproteobacteria bacterium]